MRMPINLSRSELLLVVLAMLYVVMPVDFIPELVAGPLGLTDDLAAVALVGTTLMRARRARPVEAETQQAGPVEHPYG